MTCIICRLAYNLYKIYARLWIESCWQQIVENVLTFMILQTVINIVVTAWLFYSVLESCTLMETTVIPR